ncbi:MAG: MATE family efflux transporter [Parvularculaceae bacterium]
MSAASVSYREILRLAWPASVAASVTPLLGAVDVWALAHSDRPLDIAAVGLGSVIFSLAYWTFGFIRMSVAGLTAQASGAEDETEARAALVRGGAIGAAVGLLLVLLQAPIGAMSQQLLGAGSAASAETLGNARVYFDIRIWGAPFALASYAAFGWMTARGRTDFANGRQPFHHRAQHRARLLVRDRASSGRGGRRRRHADRRNRRLFRLRHLRRHDHARSWRP